MIVRYQTGSSGIVSVNSNQHHMNWNMENEQMLSRIFGLKRGSNWGDR
jgi:hypothetical protein